MQTGLKSKQTEARLGQLQEEWISSPPARILSLCGRLNGVQSNVPFRGAPGHIALRGYMLENGSCGGNSGQSPHSKARGGASGCPVNLQSCSLDDLLQQYYIQIF